MLKYLAIILHIIMFLGQIWISLPSKKNAWPIFKFLIKIIVWGYGLYKKILKLISATNIPTNIDSTDSIV